MILYAQMNQPRNTDRLALFLDMPKELRFFLCTGYTDLRRSIDGLAAIVEDEYGMNPYAKAMYLFCGRRADRIKILLFDGDCFILQVIRMEETRFQWPRVDGQMWLIKRGSFYRLLEGEKITEEEALRVFPRIT